MTKGYKELQTVTGGEKGLQGVTGGDKRLQGVTGGDKKFTEGYKGLQRVLRVTRGDRG